MNLYVLQNFPVYDLSLLTFPWSEKVDFAENIETWSN